MPVLDSPEALAIRQEANRFESFYANIQALYNLLEQVDNVPLKRKMRELVNRIEESLLSSPEFTAVQAVDSVHEIKLGIVGSSLSGKSFLLHRYLTGSYAKVDSYTGRHKKEVIVDGQSNLLLIRNETGPPDLQFTQWIDAAIFVFSLDDELSFSMLSGYYAKMAQYRNIADIPVVLVAMNDGVSADSPALVNSHRIKKLVNDFKHCVFMQASAVTGENVDIIFQSAIEKLLQPKEGPVLTAFDPVHSPTAKEAEQAVYSVLSSSPGNSISSSAASTPSSSTKRSSKRRTMLFSGSKDKREKEAPDMDVGSGRSIPIKQGVLLKRSSSSINKEWKKKYVTLLTNGTLVYYPNLHNYMEDVHKKVINLKHTTVKVPGKRPPIASSAPQGQTSQGNSRPSTPEDGMSTDNNNSGSDSSNMNGLDSVVICNTNSDLDSVFASMGNQMTTPVGVGLNSARAPDSQGGVVKKRNKRSKHSKSCEVDSEDLEKALAVAAASAAAPSGSKVEPLSGSVKKKGHRRNKSNVGNLKIEPDAENEENWEFMIVSLEGKTWQFVAGSQEERDFWVQSIEQQILTSLQCSDSGRDKVRGDSGTSTSEDYDVQSIRELHGNDVCVDCGASSPDWASLNLGALMCIECSGVHRNLGTHVSRVRSLDLDDWPSELTVVMLAIGNTLANSVWEGGLQGRQKPSPSSSREEKEKFIRAKYEAKEFLCELPLSDFSTGEELLEAVTKEDVPLSILLLAHCTPEDLNVVNEDKNGCCPLHISCSLGNIVLTQLLIWYFADVKKLDFQGRSALWHAKSAGSKECADILRHNNCNDLGTMLPEVQDVAL